MPRTKDLLAALFVAGAVATGAAAPAAASDNHMPSAPRGAQSQGAGFTVLSDNHMPGAPRD
ncbi:hypothetical protein [Streptomyces ficellus]|uniref:Uncharacterized protein n=1 Tax=Streptomyces ficellus TaxID=1977088 RepID=A0A6I6FG24_9ACTN|nr:hypothetical protein [Streptomyces ficellus]QGV80077.1 hypothetical protein EIZ62_18920 [Streptomyces ficellus]